MTTAVLIIDMQAGMADRIAAGRAPVNPAAMDRMAALLASARARGMSVIHVHHDEPDAGSPFRKGLPGAEPMACAAPVAGEAVLWKHRSSAFAGTGLDDRLRRDGIDRLIVAGAVAAFCVTSTVRAASDLGYGVLLPTDALLGFDLPAHDGGRIDAATVQRVTLSLLGADFATLTTVDQLAAEAA
ncbi:MAG: isochorismatase family protein [Tabrizicola sp.]|uniref:isochorismatase family protein n=1 Tax=Tabrizicola sp. TaxID=2005166 RepID=UPI002733B28E|nr:isochorismatase family protein [Tabrizicola sp.]MDP3264341.1 isochorismatase family protein [Tabrizicola sp.]MDP3648614.1 isochorismatase family protein [Paracoccaceae bacterium]MDZ4067787.1 isochorismatase family protein [Tabrizicola sp.]